MINFIFNILNFLLIIAVLAYIFNKYILPNLKQQFADEKQNIVNLNDKIHNLIELQKKSDDELLEQDISCKDLKNKVEIWNTTILKKNNQKLQELSKFYNLTLDKLKEQSENYKVKKHWQQIKPNLSKILKNDFINYFEDENNVNKYINQLINQMLSES